MNSTYTVALSLMTFLNGVCRHEHEPAGIVHKGEFLNGVCRHEQTIANRKIEPNFLNGVCRHELYWSLRSE